MGLYFRKRIKILPGLTLNVSKSGTSWSVGPKGAKINMGKRGTYLTTGIPGTGIYSRTKINSNKRKIACQQKELKRQQENNAINNNPLRFFVIFFSLWLSVMLPLFGGASWWLFPVIAIAGILIGFAIPNKNKSENEIITSDESDVLTDTEDDIKDVLSDVDDVEENNVIVDEETSKRLIDNIAKANAGYIDTCVDMKHLDPLFSEVARFVVLSQSASTAQVQRKFSTGYNRAGRIMDQLEATGIVSPATGASGSAKCLVEVVPEYNTYKAPVCEFGATMEDINSKESRTLYDLTTDQLVYRGENSAVQLVLYKFESGKLKAVGVFIDMSYATEVAKYLLERYQPAANSDGLYIFINNTPSKADMFVTFGLQSGSAMVMYTSRDNASDAKDAMAKARKLAMEFD